MRFKELFWAHLMHKEMRWINAAVFLVVVSLGVAVVWPESAMTLGLFLGLSFFLVMLVVQVPYFYARAKVPLDAESRGRHYYYNAPWRVYLSQQIALMCLSILFLVWVRNPIWPRVALVIVALIVGFAAWRFFKLLTRKKSV